MSAIGPLRDGAEAFGRASFPLWNGLAVILTTDPDAADAARELVRAQTEAMDRACSRFRPDSELSRANAAAGAAIRVSPLFADVISAGLRAAVATDGAVDPTCAAGLEAAGYDRDIELLRQDGVRFTVREPVPAAGWQKVDWDPAARTLRTAPGCRLDFGAVAKALAADRAAAAAAGAVGGGVLVGLGGDIATSGPAPRDGWQVKIADDHRAGTHAAGPIVSLRGGGLATSGTTTRRWETTAGVFHHILDPRTGLPAASPWRPGSATAATCVDANTASTASLVCGESALAWLETRGLPARLVRRDGRVLTVGGWPADPGDHGAPDDLP